MLAAEYQPLGHEPGSRWRRAPRFPIQVGPPRGGLDLRACGRPGGHAQADLSALMPAPGGKVEHVDVDAHTRRSRRPFRVPRCPQAQCSSSDWPLVLRACRRRLHCNRRCCRLMLGSRDLPSECSAALGRTQFRLLRLAPPAARALAAAAPPPSYLLPPPPQLVARWPYMRGASDASVAARESSRRHVCAVDAPRDPCTPVGRGAHSWVSRPVARPRQLAVRADAEKTPRKQRARRRWR